MSSKWVSKWVCKKVGEYVLLHPYPLIVTYLVRRKLGEDTRAWLGVG